MTDSPPPPWHALAAYLREFHPDYVTLFFALSEARWASGDRGGGQGVFYECRDRLRQSLANEWVTVMTRMWRQAHPDRPLYKYRHSWLDGQQDYSFGSDGEAP